MYVRFGEPDHRSTSDSYNLEQSLEVQRVKERLAEELYGTRTDPGAFLRSTLTEGSNVVDQAGFFMPPSESSFFPGPVFPVRSMRSSISEAAGFTSAAYNEDGSGGNAGVNDVGVSTSRSGPTLNYAPVSSRGDVSMVAWESWVYTGIGGGIEITFTDEFGKGIYGFAPVPLEASVPVRQLAKLSRYSPENVVLQAARSTPDYYEAPENKNPLGFYYDLADFQGIGRQTALEVYMGIPHNMGKYMVDEKATRIEVERSVGLLNLATGAVYRQDGVIRFEGKGNLTNDRTSFVPDAVRMEVPPGRYRMEVQARDRLSRSRSRYRQEILVDPYGTERFQVSDLELAWKIEEGHSEGVFQKGELQVVPMPTRAYGRGQSVFVYYEVYNLQKDDFGRTKYQVSYTIGPKNGSPLGGVISSLVRLGRGKQQTVAVAYEQEGDATTEVEYVGLELGNIAPDQYVLKVTVTDLNSEEAVVKEAGFMVAQ